MWDIALSHIESKLGQLAFTTLYNTSHVFLRHFRSNELMISKLSLCISLSSLSVRMRMKLAPVPSIFKQGLQLSQRTLRGFSRKSDFIRGRSDLFKWNYGKTTTNKQMQKDVSMDTVRLRVSFILSMTVVRMFWPLC